MALSPSIPTSFVPKQPVSPGKKHYSGGNNIFLIISLIIAGIFLLASGGVFLYAKYLKSEETAKGAELVAAQNNVSSATVEQFVRLRDRLSTAETLINQHVELSQFFTLLESITLQNVHFTKLDITVANDGTATISMTGVATSFNALAAESTAFAGEKDIGSAIFSGITVNKDGSVGFSLNATLDKALVTEGAAPTTPAILPAVSTASSSAPTFTAAPTTTATTTPVTTVATSSASTTKP